jgi:hypothetical protein
VIVVALLTLMAVLTGGRLPLWAGLLGAAALFGAYEELYVAAPYNFLSESVIAVSSLLVPVSLGFLVGVISTTLWGEEASDGPLPYSSSGPSAGLAIMAEKQENAS